MGNVSYDIIMNILGELLAGIVGMVFLLLIWRPFLRLLELLSPAFRRLRFVRTGLVTRIYTDTPIDSRKLGEAPFVALQCRDAKLRNLFDTNSGKPTPGVFVLHGSVKAGKWMWILNALLKKECDAYELKPEKLFISRESFEVVPELAKYLCGVGYSLYGIPANKVFVVELPDRTSDLEIEKQRAALEAFCHKVSHPVTFILKASGFVSVNPNAASRTICLETLSPSECTDFIEHDVWKKKANVAANISRYYLGEEDARLFIGRNPEMRRQLSRSLWISTLGQPALLHQRIESVQAQSEWEARLRLIEVNQEKQYAVECVVAFLTLVALLAESTKEDTRKLNWRTLANACGIGDGYAYGHFAKVIRKIYRFNIEGNYGRIDRDHLVFPGNVQDGNLEHYFFDNRFEASVLLLKCCKFDEAHDYSAAMSNYVSTALMNVADIDEDDRRRAGRNLAAAIIENRPWDRWEEEYTRFEENWPFDSEVSEIREAFRCEYERLSREHSILSSMENCVDGLEDKELAAMFSSLFRHRFGDDATYCESIVRGLRLLAAEGFDASCIAAMKIDFVRLNAFLGSCDAKEAEVIAAIALLCLDFKVTLQGRYILSEIDSEVFARLTDLVTGLLHRYDANSPIHELLRIESEYATTGEISDECLAVIKSSASSFAVPENPYLADAVIYILRQWNHRGACDSTDRKQWRSCSGFLARRYAYEGEIERTLSSATAETWPSVKETLYNELRPKPDDYFQNIVFATILLKNRDLMPREELAIWIDFFLSRQSDWFSVIRHDLFFEQFLELGLSIAEFGSSSALESFMRVFESVFCRDEAVKFFIWSYSDLRDYSLLVRLLSDRRLKEMDAASRRTVVLGWLLLMVFNVRNGHMNYSPAEMKRMKSVLVDQDGCLDIIFPNTYAEILFASLAVLTHREIPENGYPSAEECCRCAKEMLLADGNKPLPERIATDIIALVLKWIYELLALQDDGTADLVRNALTPVSQGN